jgi:hypothetical protein
VILVDTPGLGSLALEGAAETLAYLPQCDLGVVLVDASSNLHTDDVATVDALRAASVPALVVLSKADLIPEPDRQQLLSYTRTQLARQIGMEIDVALLSSLPELHPLLQKWVAHQIAPRVADAKELSRESNHRKLRALARRILHALEISAKSNGARSDQFSGGVKEAETRLRNAASLIETTYDECFKLTGAIRDAGEGALDQLAEAALHCWEQDGNSSTLDQSWIATTIHQLAQTEAERLANLLQSAARELTAALDTAASAISTGERDERFDLQSLVKDMPPAEFATAPIHLEKPRWLSVSVAMARRSIRNELQKRVGSSVGQFFLSYSRTLEVWVRGTLDRLAREFETHADIYRAQFQRLTTAASSAGVPRERVAEDISVLKQELGLNETEQPVESGAAIS